MGSNQTIIDNLASSIAVHTEYFRIKPSEMWPVGRKVIDDAKVRELSDKTSRWRGEAVEALFQYGIFTWPHSRATMSNDKVLQELQGVVYERKPVLAKRKIKEKLAKAKEWSNGR